MHKIVRNSLFIIFIILFIIITFFVSIYASGYSINKRWPIRFDDLFQKTGMLSIASRPSNAKIFIDGEKQKKSVLLDINRNDITTPAKIKNLRPGEYQLRLEKDGYWPVEKKIEINPEQTTFAEDFIMFKKTLPLNMALCEPQPLIFSPNKKNLILASDAILINLRTGLSSAVPIEENEIIQWSKNSNQFLANNNIVNANNQQVNNELNLISDDAHGFYWDENNRRLYYQSESKINYVTIDNNISSTLLSESDYLNYAVRQGLIYTIERQNGNFYLRIYDLNTSWLKNSIEIPRGDYKFHQEDYRLTLHNELTRSLYILNDLAENPILQKINNTISWQWLSSRIIIWHNDLELYSMDIINGQKQLIIRLSEPLTGVVWSKSRSYLIYSSKKNIWITNLNVNKVAPTKLLTAENINHLHLDEKGQIIYFYAEIGQRSGIYKLQLQ